MRVIVCGGRDYEEWPVVNGTLTELLYNEQDVVIISGCAKGADRLGERWANLNKRKLELYPSEWKKYGKAAGIMRNQDMLDTGVDLVIAFPGGTGTAHMINIAKASGVKVIEV